MPQRPRPDVLPDDFADESLITGEAVALDLRPTGFVLNCAAGAIDLLLYLGGGALLLKYVLLPATSAVLGNDSATTAAVSLAGSVLCIVIAPALVEVLTRGKSLGRLAVGARIVRDDGGAIGLRHASIRALTGSFEIFSTLGSLAAVVALFNGKAKRLGDLLAGTFSQYERVSREIVPTYGVPTELVTWANTADVAKLPDRLARRISQFLRQAGRFSPAARTRISAELAAEASAWVYPVPAAPPELFLAAIIAIRRQRELTGHLLEDARLRGLDAALTGLPHQFPDRH